MVEDSQDEDFEPGTQFTYGRHLLALSLTIMTLDDGLVACPMCSRKMKNEAVFSHLDKCTGEEEKPKPSQR